MIFAAILLLFFASQLYWAWAARRLIARKFRTTRARLAAGGVLLAVYGFLFVYNFWHRQPAPVHLTPADIFLVAPFLWWAASSAAAFLVALLVSAIRALRPPVSPARRAFLTRAAVGAPFVAGAYGLLYARLNLETTRQPIRLHRLPKAFHGIRMAQLSDIHIGPFMPEEQIRSFAAIANELKPDIILLTGDFVTWDARTEYAAVKSLSRLKAPLGIYGCLGNHDAWAGVEDSITALFREAGVRILRQQRAPVTAGGETLNLIGVDFQTLRHFGPSAPVGELLAGVPELMSPSQANILLSHNPDTFDRAAALGIDFSLAGHTHGGQVALEFISPDLAPSRLVTPYVAGWFEQPGGQLYVNRGLGTIGVPIRLGAPPEITLFELLRG